MNDKSLRIDGVMALVGLVTLSRLISPPVFGHPSNFSPVDAIALFSGAYCATYIGGALLTLVAVVASDQVVNYMTFGHAVLFYDGCAWPYVTYLLLVLLGRVALGRPAGASAATRFAKIAGCSVAGSLIFFAITNFGVWYSTAMYPKTAAGLSACYWMALPFLRLTIVSDLLYSGILFGIADFYFASAERRTARRLATA